jgi:glycine cleavage system H lipoate-binding protein
MTVLLVILTFGVFILLDYVVNRRRAPQPVAASAPPSWLPEPVWVAGYQLPEALHYHPGHTWARVGEDDAVVVGIDDFARRLVGPARSVRTPAPGDWLEQGAPAIELGVDARSTQLVSPVAGEVVEVNPELAKHPELVSDDPYGRGWLFKVRPAHLKTNMRNLLSGRLAQRWIEDAREALDLRLMALSGSVLQDGGEPVADYARHLPDEEWKRLVGQFLLT